jgi:hypothetical protein
MFYGDAYDMKVTHVLCNSVARSCNHSCHGKAISIIYSECEFVPLGTQHVRRRVLLSIVACPVILYFSKLSHKRHNVRKNVIEHKTCVSVFSTNVV